MIKNNQKILNIISISLSIVAITAYLLHQNPALSNNTIYNQQVEFKGSQSQTELQDSIKPYEIEYEYTDEDLYFRQFAVEETYEVQVLKIFKEKNKEDVYLIEFGNDLDFGVAKEIELTKTEYLKHIGEGNNRVRGNQYCLEMYVKNKGIQEDGTNGNLHIIRARRYSFLGENDFSKEEVRQIVDYTKNRCSKPYVIPIYTPENPHPLDKMCKTHTPSVDFWEEVTFTNEFKPITELALEC